MKGKKSFLWRDQKFNPEWPKRAFIYVDYDSVKYHFQHAALLKSKSPLITMSLHKHTFHITCMTGYKESTKRERKAAKRAMNWSRKHFYANKMTAVNFLFIHFEMFSLFCPFFTSHPMWICRLIKTYKHDHMNGEQKNKRERNLRVELQCSGGS